MFLGLFNSTSKKTFIAALDLISSNYKWGVLNEFTSGASGFYLNLATLEPIDFASDYSFIVYSWKDNFGLIEHVGPTGEPDDWNLGRIDVESVLSLGENISIRQLHLNPRTLKLYFFMTDVAHGDYKIGIAKVNPQKKQIEMLYDEMVEIQHKTGFVCSCKI